MPPTTQANSATLIIGPTGHGKSTLAYTLAQYLWETHGKVLYYANCDPGGFPGKVQEGIAVGIIKAFKMRTRDAGDLGLSFETCQRVCQGWWPATIKPSTGEVPPGVPMVPPVRKTWTVTCPHCATVVKTVPSQQLLTPQACPSCKKIVTKADMRVSEAITVNPAFADRGGLFIDSLSSMLAWDLMDLGRRAGNMELKGEEAAIGGKIRSGDMSFGGTTRSHVGFVQSRGEELAHVALSVPGLVVPVVMTALSMEDTDERHLSIVGPKIAGRAKTDEAGAWFGNCLEAAKVPVQNGEAFTLFLSEFTDREGRRHLLKNRAAPGMMPEVLQDPPIVNGVPTGALTQFNLGLFFKRLDEALASGITQAREQYPNAPGVVDDWVQFDEATVKVETPSAEPPAVAATAQPSPQAPAAQPVPMAPPAAQPRARKPPAPKPAPAAPQAQAAPAAPPAPVQAEPTATAGAGAPQTPMAAAPVSVPAPVAQAPVAAPPVATVAPAATSAALPTPVAPSAPVPRPATPQSPRPAGVAPPAGVRPGNPIAQVTGPGTPRPTAAVARPPAAAPRPPAAAPRPAPAPGAPVKP